MSAILRFAKTRPFAFGMGYSLFKTSGCDLMVQKVVEKREEIDWKRNIAFGTFGLFYLGGVQYILYVPIFSRLFPNAASFAAKTIAEKARDAQGIRTLLAQVFIDQGVHHPLMYFPVFYMIKDFVTSDKPDPVRAVTEYKHNAQEDLIALWKVWIPSTLLNFAFMPMWARIPWVASTSLIWTCILSAMRGGSDVPVSAPVFVGVDHDTMALVTKTVVGPPPRLDPSQSHVLIIARGRDEPGIISSISQRLYSQNATITTSKMLSLGDEFAIMMHASCAPEKLTDLINAVSDNRRLHKTKTGSMIFDTKHGGYNLSIRALKPPAEDEEPPVLVAKLWLTGVDKPGLLYRLSQVIGEQHMNIEHLQTEQHAGDTKLFSVHCHVVSSNRAVPDLKQLKMRLKELEGKLGVRCAVEVIKS
uniref:ACT domain-containing protein n=1 Tax=Haptolina brevifila TaxID=156173 RepID=A0A7S2IVA5_9EUKA